MRKKKSWQILAATLFLAFLVFSFFVSQELFTKLDFDTTVKLQDNLPPVVDFPFSLLSVLGSAEVSGLIWLGLTIYLFTKGFVKTSLAMMLLPLAIAIEIFGKIFVYHPAPPHLFYRGVIQFDFPSSYVAVEYAYPSGHLTRTAFLVVFFGLYLYLYHSKKSKQILIFLLTLFLFLMFISRIYLGEHWLTDVIGGLLIGSSFGIFAALTLPQKKT